MSAPNTYQERREAKKFIDQRMKDLRLDVYTLMNNLRRDVPAKVKAAKRTVDAFEKYIRRRAERMSSAYQRKYLPIQEDVVLGRFSQALQKLKVLEKEREKLFRNGIH